MLAITRKKAETIYIGEIVVTVTNINSQKGRANLSIDERKTLTIHAGQAYSLSPTVSIKAISIKRSQVRLGITAPDDVHIMRGELVDREVAELIND